MGPRPAAKQPIPKPRRTPNSTAKVSCCSHRSVRVCAEMLAWLLLSKSGGAVSFGLAVPCHCSCHVASQPLCLCLQHVCAGSQAVSTSSTTYSSCQHHEQEHATTLHQHTTAAAAGSHNLPPAGRHSRHDCPTRAPSAAEGHQSQGKCAQLVPLQWCWCSISISRRFPRG